MVRKCSRCGSTENFTPSDAKREWNGGYCQPCKSSHNKEWRTANKERHSQRQREWVQKRRNAILEHYGARCVCCGETEPAFLAIDHKNNDGYIERRTIKAASMYHHIVKSGFPDTYQILCHNCNMAKYRLGKCPHERTK